MIKTSRLARLEHIFRVNFIVKYLEIENQSAQHSGHYSGDGESHWRVLLVSQDFSGLSRIQRHQKVNGILKHEFEQGMHAMTLQLLEPSEWNLR